MTDLITSTFATRRDAELVVEHLVQTHGLSRDAVTIHTQGEENTVGDRASGGDLKAADPTVASRSDAPIQGRIKVSVTPSPSDDKAMIQDVFREFDGET